MRYGKVYICKILRHSFSGCGSYEREELVGVGEDRKVLMDNVKDKLFEIAKPYTNKKYLFGFRVDIIEFDCIWVGDKYFIQCTDEKRWIYEDDEEVNLVPCDQETCLTEYQGKIIIKDIINSDEFEKFWEYKEQIRLKVITAELKDYKRKREDERYDRYLKLKEEYEGE